VNVGDVVVRVHVDVVLVDIRCHVNYGDVWISIGISNIRCRA
jgi:hypothetical protein